MMKLIVMGAGYVGMALLTSFQKLSHELLITTTQEKRIDFLKNYGKEVILLKPDYHQDPHFLQLMSECEGMVILVAPRTAEDYEDTYLHTAKNISSILKNRQHPFYLLYTSSTSVCEGLSNEWVTEETPLEPKSKNAKILFETEQCYVNCQAQVCVLRLGGIYGPGRELIDRARRLSGKEIPGTGNEPTNHIQLEDIVNGIIHCFSHSLTGVYHLVNDDHPTRKQLYDSLCKADGIPCPKWNPNLLKNTRGGYKVCNEKIKKTNFIFKHLNLTI